MDFTPFKVNIPQEELDLLKKKLELARLPHDTTSDIWGEDNGVTNAKIAEIVDFWKTSYDWRAEEKRLNSIPQFTTSINVDGFDDLTIHFAHSVAEGVDNAIPILFLHGWPGNWTESYKIIPKLNEAGFDVVAPSLPGFGFSSYTNKPGFKHEQHAEVMHKLMTQRLGYESYVVQGGDWGSFIARTIAIKYPEQVKACHLNMVVMTPPDFDKQPEYSAFEQAALQHANQFNQEEAAYREIQATKPRTLGFALHDSPVGMLAWMADKLHLWTDDYPWTPTELITWTLLHYFPGPTTAMQMYRENNPEQMRKARQWNEYVKIPSGVSAFPKELMVVPRSWAETKANIVFWQEHEHGGHFAAFEKPDEFSGDLIKFYKSVWK